MNSQDKMTAGGEHVLACIMTALRDERGVHVESLFACLGALAGYACQVAVRQNALSAAGSGGPALVAVKTADGETYLYGDALNAPLAESPFSLWTLVSSTLQKLGAPPPDIHDIFRHAAKTLGSREFGVPRVAADHQPRDLPLRYLKELWPQILPRAQTFCAKPMQLPIIFGVAIQRAIEQAKGTFSPTLAASIAMESAVAMSKVILQGAPASPAPSGGGGRVKAKTPANAVQRTAVPGRPTQASVMAGLPPLVRAVTIAVLAIVAVAGGLWRASVRDRHQAEREAEREGPRALTRSDQEVLRQFEQGAREAEARKKQQREAEIRVESQAPPQAAPAIADEGDPQPPQ